MILSLLVGLIVICPLTTLLHLCKHNISLLALHLLLLDELVYN